MTLVAIRGFMIGLMLCGLATSSYAQPVPVNETENSKTNKPYKILTSGKQITIKSTKNIKSIMVWSASGHRVVEQQEVNTASFTFTVNVSEKVFFVMIQYEGSKPYTEKIGVQ